MKAVIHFYLGGPGWQETRLPGEHTLETYLGWAVNYKQQDAKLVWIGHDE